MIFAVTEKGRNEMQRYYEETALIEFVKKYTPTINGETTMECVERAIREAPTADVVPKSEVAELLRLMFNDDCACNYNGNDEWLPFKCKFALTDCPMPQERLGCWMEFVEYGLAELKKKYQEGEPNGN